MGGFLGITCVEVFTAGGTVKALYKTHVRGTFHRPQGPTCDAFIYVTELLGRSYFYVVDGEQVILGGGVEEAMDIL